VESCEFIGKAQVDIALPKLALFPISVRKPIS